MASKREQLIDTALGLFNQHGFHATGIDRIVAEAGVARMTLYNHFKSKDELILATLHRRDEEFRNWFMRAVEDRTSAPRGRLLALFDVLGEWFRGEAMGGQPFLGCTFIKAACEFTDGASAEHRAAAMHADLLHDYVKKLARDAGAVDPDLLAGQLMLLKQGAIVVAHVSGDIQAGERARVMAEPLIALQIPG
jgi:AcrR family transcriptional regulator